MSLSDQSECERERGMSVNNGNVEARKSLRSRDLLLFVKS